jgi:large subunit ribosomal protein L6
MSRIGKKPITIPQGVEVKKEKDSILVKGPKGQLKVQTHEKIDYQIEDNQILVKRVDDTRTAREQHGLRRTLLDNAIIGVSKGFTKTLEVVGIGYKVNVKGKTIELNVGYSHPVTIDLPQDIDAKVDGNKLTIMGIDKHLVGEFAAKVRRVRPPEPYKGKGIKYIDEHIRRKAGKSGGK